MARIRLLPESLSNKIAAGEVVERPASVVKELVENSLDAGSRQIVVEIKQGGRRLIRVSDDGTGMSADDALLCLERYATSKISRDQDLFAIRTLGFRGEALPSIAAVSRFTLVTRDRASESATRIEVHGGRIQKVTEVGAPVGTVVTVSDLFYNTPARRKFLKRVETEMGHIADTVVAMALGRPEVSFELVHNGRRVRRFGKCPSQSERVKQILGEGIEREFFPLRFCDGYLELKGWIGRPSVVRSTSRGIYVFVNGRRVSDRLVQHALFEGYAGRLLKGRYPLAVLYLKLPCDQVDVNVHPTKHQVRFTDSRRIHDTIRDQVAAVLAGMDRPRWRPPSAGNADRPEQPRIRFARIGFESQTPAVEEQRPTPARGEKDGGFPVLPAGGSKDGPGNDSGALQEQEGGLFGQLEVIGQFGGSYIVGQAADDLIIVDQHAACERIAYEALKKAALAKRPESQRLLVPQTLELGFSEAHILEILAAHLASWGLEVEPFGGNSFVIKSYPVLLDPADLEDTVRQMVEVAAETGLEQNLEKTLENCLKTMACHNSLRAHHRLNREQMEQILVRLDGCDDPFHCPHGRPTYVRWSLRELEKAFGRRA